MTSTFKDPVITVERAVNAAGNKASLARQLGLSRATVSEWGEVVPALHAYRLVQIYPELDTSMPDGLIDLQSYSSDPQTYHESVC